MRKAIDACFVALCLLTIANTDYSGFGALDVAVFACMGLGIASAAILFFVQRRKGKGK